MSGHSKWSQIKHKKAQTDVKRGQIFGKLAKIIQIAARKNADPNANPELRAAVEKAKAANLPAENIARAIKKGGGQLAGAKLENARYEAYGPGGAAIIIETITDNKNRLVSEIKHILSKHNAKLAGTDAVIWAFEKINGQWKTKTPLVLNEQNAAALNQLIEELDNHDDVQEIYTNVE
ncbi:MAG: YebC/PmpR family DNA-binding transcriptional regulator [Candidatus Niyogibacteria bacterium]|nr:YebC/PmpR family DNA-binding transcriptional regulator [Candidatus Niyogibacteria bacterium]